MNFDILRRQFFWLTDLAKGKPVKRHYNDIKLHFNLLSVKTKNSNIEQLLKHAVNTTKFYSKINDFSKLDQFPVINKTIIRESFNNFLSDKFTIKELIPIVTSGSTGTPFKIYQDKNKKNRNYADTIYFAKLAGYEIGHQLLYMKIWAKQKMKNPVLYWLQNMKPIDVIKLDDKQISNIIKKMENNRCSYGILGYASALELVCRYLDNYHPANVKADVRSIITMSESLNEYTKDSLKQYFNVSVVSRYSNLENGIIAQQEINGLSRFLVNTASYYVEILKINSDEKEVDGVLGRIVVTDLYNYGMPLIRYDTGDIGAIECDPNNPDKLYLSKVEGRKLDVLYDTKGNIVSSYIMYKNMWQYTEIKQYQLIQEGEKEYVFKINVENVFNREKQLVDEYKSYLGEDADFKVVYVKEIPLLASGKRRKLVNNYKKLN